MIFPLSVMADDEISLTCDKVEKLNIGEEIICRVAVNSDFFYNKINFDVLNTEGLQIIDIRSNYERRWKVEENGNKVSVIADEVQSDLQEFGIILIKSVKSGEQDLTLDNITLENTNETDVRQLNAINQKLKVVSSDNLLKSITINEKELVNFDANKTNYIVEIEKDDTIKIGAESNNEFATINGIGEFKLSDKVNKFVFPINVVSEDNISKVYLINVVRKNKKVNEEIVLDDLIIKNDKGNILLIDFKPNIFEYSFEVDLNTSYINVKPSVSGDNCLVKGFGEQKYELKSGNNVILVKVQNKDGDIANYVLNVIKPIANKSSNNYIKNLLIDDYKIDFSKRIKNYVLEINPKDDVLRITPILESDNARYEITGNKNLKNGSIIRIIVTAENEEKAVYKITIKEKKTNHSKTIILIILTILGLYAVYKLKDIIVKKYKNNKKKQVVSTKVKVVSSVEPVKKETNKEENIKVASKSASKKSSVKNKNTSSKNKVASKASSSKANNKKTTNKTSTTKKRVTNSTSSRSPRSNYTKKSPVQRKKTNKKNTTRKNNKKK